MPDPRANRQLQDAAISLIRRYPRQAALLAVGLIVLVGLVALGYFVWTQIQKQEALPVGGDGRPATVLFCAWNVENFYDDQDDPKIRDEWEDWFGTDPGAFELKVDRLAAGLLLMNDGAGPDVACLCEVESERCMTALKDALNEKLEAAGKGDRKYEHVLFKGDNMGRHFAPGILTRLGVTADRTRKLGKRGNGRIVEGHLHQNGHELVVIVAHWTSRVTDKEGDRRADYAEDCYGRVKAILHENPDADVIVCGDFNDDFRDPSIRNELHATDGPDEVRKSADEPRLLDLFARWGPDKDPPGSIYSKDHGKWSVFDHICVTRGLLDDRGWSCDPATAAVFAPGEFRRKVGKRFEPFKFGNKHAVGNRGYSDHFPVTVRLTVAAADDK